MLPADVQDHIARTLSRLAAAPSRSSVLPVGLVVTLAAPPEDLADSGALSPQLSRWLGDAQVQLPRLADRAEDLRALVFAALALAALALAALAHTGPREAGEPLGIDPAALRLLMEHSLPGNELELRNLLTRAAARSRP